MAEELEADSRLHPASTAAPLLCSGQGHPPLSQAAYAPLSVIAALNIPGYRLQLPTDLEQNWV